MWDWHDGPDGWGWLAMGLMMLFVWLPLLVILVWALRQFAIPRQPPPEPPSSAPSVEPDAREIARRAYARGEMERERFLEMMRDLDETAPPGDASR